MTHLTEDQRDCLQEVTNVAMGQAGDGLARFLQTFIHLSVPRIELIEASQLEGAFNTRMGATKVTALRQGFRSATGITNLVGESISLFTEASYHEIAELMSYEGQVDAMAKEELLLDISNLVAGACVKSIASQLDEELDFSPPSIIGENIYVKDVVDTDNLQWSRALLVDIIYTLESRSFHCELLLVMPDAAIDSLKRSLDHILESY